jgi:hypothetical protein
VALLLCGASPELATLLDAPITRHLLRYAGVPEALTAARSRAARQFMIRRTSARFAPTANAPAEARYLVTRLCEERGIVHL